MSRTLRGLLERELVSVDISAADARQRVYRLTEAGRRVLDGLRASRERAIASVWAGFEDEALAGFVRFSRALGDGLESYARSSEGD